MGTMLIQESTVHTGLDPSGSDLKGCEARERNKWGRASRISMICSDVMTASLVAEHALWYLDDYAGTPGVELCREQLELLSTQLDRILAELVTEVTVPDQTGFVEELSPNEGSH